MFNQSGFYVFPKRLKHFFKELNQITVVYPVLICQSFLLGYSKILSVGVIELELLTFVGGHT